MSWIRTAFRAFARRLRFAPAGPGARAVRTQEQLEGELEALGWRLEGPTRTSSGWKGTIHRRNVSILETSSSTIEALLEALLLSARQREDEDEPQGQP